MSPVATSKLRSTRPVAAIFDEAAWLTELLQIWQALRKGSVRFLSTRAALYARSWAEMAREARLACTIRPMSSLEFTKARRDAESHAQPVAGMLRSTRHRANHSNLRNGGRKLKESVMPHAAALADPRDCTRSHPLSQEIRRFPMLEPRGIHAREALA